MIFQLIPLNDIIILTGIIILIFISILIIIVTITILSKPCDRIILGIFNSKDYGHYKKNRDKIRDNWEDLIRINTKERILKIFLYYIRFALIGTIILVSIWWIICSFIIIDIFKYAIISLTVYVIGYIFVITAQNLIYWISHILWPVIHIGEFISIGKITGRVIDIGIDNFWIEHEEIDPKKSAYNKFNYNTRFPLSIINSISLTKYKPIELIPSNKYKQKINNAEEKV